MQAKRQEVQTVLNGLSDDVKELMAQRDSEILAAAQAEEAARKAAAAAALPRTRTIPRVVRSGGSYAAGTRNRMPARANEPSSTRATPRLRRVGNWLRGVGYQCLP